MKRSIFTRFPLYCAFFAALIACGDESSSSGSSSLSCKTIVGVTQKGPFVNGSSVTVQELNAKTLAQTGFSYEGKIKNDKGEFSVTVEQMSSSYALLKANGYFRNEVTGQKSNGQMILYALSDLSKREEVNVNLLTHLEYERVLHLVSEKSLSITEAKKQAQKEIFAAFGIEVSDASSEDLNIFGSSEGDAALLAISILMLGNLSEADFSERLAIFAQDLESDGLWNDETTKAAIADWAYQSNTDKIRTNIMSWGLSTTVPDFENKLTGYWSYIYGLNDCNENTQGFISRVNNAYSRNNGTNFICDNNTWRKATQNEVDLDGWNEGKDGEIKKADASGSYYIYDNGEWRVATETESALGGCTESLQDTIKQVFDVYYICINRTWENASQQEYDTYGWDAGKDGEIKKGDVSDTLYIYDTEEWRIATKFEYNTYNFVKDTLDGAWKQGNIDQNQYYVYEKSEGTWREATTPKDYTDFNGCTDLRQLEMDTVHYADEINDVYADTIYFCYNRKWYSKAVFHPELPQEAYFNPNIKYGELKDPRDGRVYRTVVIGTQTWMAENLRYLDSVETPSLKGNVSCKFESSVPVYTPEFGIPSEERIQPQCVENFGPTYEYAAAIDSVNIYKTLGLKCGYYKDCELEEPVRGICPEDWHIPSVREWIVLGKYIGGEEYVFAFTGDNTKYAELLSSRLGWNHNSEDSYGFSAIPKTTSKGDYLFRFIVADPQNLHDKRRVYAAEIRCIKD